MCAHGAIAYCGNSKVRDEVLCRAGAKATTSAVRGASATRIGVADFGAAMENLSTSDYIRKYHNGEVGLAHYLAAQAGLTFGFNDNCKTSKQDVINKLREASNSSISL